MIRRRATAAIQRPNARPSQQAHWFKVTFEGTSGVSSGSEDALPHYLSFDRGAPIAADCCDLLDRITPGETWTANIDTLAQAASSGMFASNPGHCSLRTKGQDRSKGQQAEDLIREVFQVTVGELNSGPLHAVPDIYACAPDAGEHRLHEPVDLPRFERG